VTAVAAPKLAAPDGAVATAPRLVVPAYAHPADAPDLWRRLVAGAAALRLVVVNPHDGPGAAVDPAYPPVVAALQAAGIRCAGYVDTAYGERSPAEVADQITTYVERHALHAVFLDQVSSGLDQLEHYAQVVRLARAAGARFVALNPGTQPHPGYLTLANLTVTFEGPWSEYRPQYRPQPGSARVRPGQVTRECHLVHSVPTCELLSVLDAGSAAGVDSMMVTDGAGANPWDRLPPRLVQEVVSRRPSVSEPVAAGAPTTSAADEDGRDSLPQRRRWGRTLRRA
jgi:hypothetical protein